MSFFRPPFSFLRSVFNYSEISPSVGLSVNGNWNVALHSQKLAEITLDTVEFGELANSTVFSAHMQAGGNGSIYVLNSYTVSGGAGFSNNAARHYRMLSGGIISFNDFLTVTLSNTPKFAVFADSQSTGIWQGYETVFSGSVETGCQKHSISGNAVINTFGGGNPSTFFPGSVAGVIQSGGQFV